MVTRLTSDQYNDPITGSMPNIIPSVQFAAPIHCHDYYEFFLITKGSVLHIVNNDIQRLTEGALVFVRPDDIHCYDYDGNSDCEFLNIPFAAPMIEEAFAYLGEAFDSRRLIKAKMPPFTFILSWAKERLLNLVSRIQMASMNDKTHARVILKGLLIEIFTQYFSESSPGADSSIPVWLENLMIEMHKKEKFIEGITAMYDLASCTPGHLNKVFKKYFKTTPTNYINRLRIDYAKYLLLTTHMGITDISLKAGFGNLSHFYHVFRRIYGITPLEMRKIQKA